MTQKSNKEFYTTPTVSVIMNCFNCDPYLREAIDSVYNQTFQDWEIIFWDNASTDHSREIAQSYDARLKYFYGSKTVPLGEARNLALEQASGEFIAFLDCDDSWTKNKLEEQIPVFRKNPNVALVHGNSICFIQKTGASINYFSRWGRLPSRGNIFFSLLFWGEQIVMSSVVVRKIALDAVGGSFNKKYTSAEDYELFLRLAKLYECDFVEQVVAMRRVHSMSFVESNRIIGLEECQRVFEDFANDIDGFYANFADQIKSFNESMLYGKGIAYWSANNKKEARNNFKKLTNKKWIIYYLLSFFSFAFFKVLYDWLLHLRFFLRKLSIVI